MTENNKENATLSVKRTSYTADAQSKRDAVDFGVEMFANDNRGMASSPIEIPDDAFFSEGSSGSDSSNVTVITDSRKSKLIRREAERVNAVEFKPNASLKEVCCSFGHKIHGVRIQNSCRGNIALIVVFSIILCIVAACYSEYNATYREIKTMERRIEAYQSEQKQLKMAIEEKDKFSSEMEEYVTKVLGMVKEDNLTKHYIVSVGVDTVSFDEGRNNYSANGGTLLSGFKTILSRLFPSDD